MPLELLGQNKEKPEAGLLPAKQASLYQYHSMAHSQPENKVRVFASVTMEIRQSKFPVKIWTMQRKISHRLEISGQWNLSC
jgi:hypothetical protein